MSCNNVFRKIAPSGDCRLALVTPYSQGTFVTLLSIHIDLDVKYDYSPQEPHALLGDSQQLCTIFGEFDSFDGGIEVPYFDALPRSDIPEAYCVVRCSAS